MFSASCFALTAALLSLIGSSSAGYSAASKDNVAIYYGQGPNERDLGLHDFCLNSPKVDIIPLAFLDIYPAQGNGWPGTNFASSCESTNFAAPGYNGVNDPSKNDLKNNCSSLVDGIAFCQSLNKQILLSLGGAPGSTLYQLTSTADADYLADFLWGAFGPLQNPNTWPRPFDTPTTTNSVDGFDFDIEVIQPGEQQLYIRMINRLIGHFPTDKGAKKYLITGAPQCIVPDSQMGDMISAVPFDILFVQYYNTDSCSARSWITANPQYPSVPENPSGFSYEFDQLLTFLDTGASKNAKIFFGLPGAAAAANANQYLDPAEVAPFLEAYYCQPRFGGVMVWEGIYAYNNMMFQNTMKDLLVEDSTNKALQKCPTSPPPCCTNPYTIAPGDSCYQIYTDNKLSPDQFYALNPSLGPQGALCNYLQPGQTLCLARASSTTAVCSVPPVTKTTSTTSGTPTPTQCVTCTEYYVVQPGDYCYLIQTTHTNLTSDEFYALNPSYNNGKSCNLHPGDKVCIAGTVGACPTTSSTIITTTTSSTSSSSTRTSTTTSSTSSSSSTRSSTTTSSSTSRTSSGTSSSTSTSLATTSSTTSHTSSSSLATTSSTTSHTSSSSLATTSSTTSHTSSSSSSTTSITSSSTSSQSTSSTASTTSTSKSSTSSSTTSPTTSPTTSSTSSSTTNSTSSISSSSSLITTSSVASSTSSASPRTSSSSISSSSLSSTSYTSFGNSTTSSAISSSSAISTTSPVTYTTTTTSVYTVTSCPPTVTNCPVGKVTTDIITLTTTYCPGNATSAPTTTASPVQYTTSVVYTTLTYTITACPATVTNCPAKMGSVTTETKVLYTTICPVAALTTPVTVPTSAAPGSPGKEISNPAITVSPSTSLIFSPVTYSTVSVPKASSSSSSFAVVYQTMSVMPVASTSPSKSVVASVASASPVKPSSATFTGGAANAASLGVGGIMAVILCMVGWALM